MVRDFQQNRRDRAIAITDIAISKVRETRFRGFDSECLKEIQKHHKEVLKEAQRLNKLYHTNKMEVGILIDIHTWNYWTIYGKKECEVQMKDNLDAYKVFVTAKKNQLMFIHNHPSTGTFSGEDLKFFCNNESLYMVTVVGNNGSIYALTKTPYFDIRILADYGLLADSYYKQGHINNNGTLAIHDILKIADKYGLEYKKGSHK